MKTFAEQRKFFLAKLKEMGVKAPVAMYPSRVHDDNKDSMIDRMKAHVCDIAQMQEYQRQNKEEEKVYWQA